MAEKAWQQEHETAAGHVESSARRGISTEIMLALDSLSPFYSVWVPGPKVDAAHI